MKKSIGDGGSKSKEDSSNRQICFVHAEGTCRRRAQSGPWGWSGCEEGESSTIADCLVSLSSLPFPKVHLLSLESLKSKWDSNIEIYKIKDISFNIWRPKCNFGVILFPKRVCVYVFYYYHIWFHYVLVWTYAQI